MAIYKLKTNWNGQTHKDVENYIKQCILRFIGNECMIMPNDIDGKSIKDNTGELSFVMYDNIMEDHSIYFEVECVDVRRTPVGEGSWVAPTASSIEEAIEVVPVDDYLSTAIYKMYSFNIDQSKLRTSDHKSSSGEYDETEDGANFGYTAALKVTPFIKIENNTFTYEKKPMYLELKGVPIVGQQLMVIDTQESASQTGTDISTMTMKLGELATIDTRKGFGDTTLNYTNLTNFNFSVSAMYGSAAKQIDSEDSTAVLPAGYQYFFDYNAPTEVPSAEENNGQDYFYDTITYKAWWGNGSASMPKIVEPVVVKVLKVSADPDPEPVEETDPTTDNTSTPISDPIEDGGSNGDPVEMPPEETTP